MACPGHDPAWFHTLSVKDGYGCRAYTVVGVRAAQTGLLADVWHHIPDGVDAQRLVLEPYIIGTQNAMTVLLKQPGATRMEFAQVQLDQLQQTVVAKLTVLDSIVASVLVAG